MKKTTHLVLYTIIFACIAILLFKQFILTKDEASSEIHKINTPQIKPVINESSLKVNIAYVNSDTVSKYYNYAKKLQKSLLTKRAEAESQIKNKYSSCMRSFSKE